MFQLMLQNSLVTYIYFEHESKNPTRISRRHRGSHRFYRRTQYPEHCCH